MPPPAAQWHDCGFRPDHSRGAAGDFHSLPLKRNRQKNPQTDYSARGFPSFILKLSLRPRPDSRGLQDTDSLWQVFWLPRPFSDLPIPIDRNSGMNAKRVPFLDRKRQGYSGGPAPDFNGIPLLSPIRHHAFPFSQGASRCQGRNKVGFWGKPSLLALGALREPANQSLGKILKKQQLNPF